MARASLTTRITAAAVATVIATGIAYGIWSRFGGPRSSSQVELLPGAEDEVPWRGQRAYSEDPVVGRRPTRLSIVRTPMLALDGTDVQETVKHRDAHAFLRQRPLPNLQAADRVLMVGDSHLDGVVSTEDNLSTLLEDQAMAKGKPTVFLNAGCGLYSLWQSVLRACDLMPHYQPKVVVVVVFLGNDFLDMENPTVPHLDDELRHQPAVANAPPETTSDRMKRLAMVDPFSQLFWQGLNQAMYLLDRPERLPVLARKAGHAIEHMQSVATANHVDVLWALLPSFDLVFEEQAKGFGKGAEAVIRSGAQRRMRDAFVAELMQRNANVVDLDPAFRANGDLATLYAMDFHIYRLGHSVAADALAQPIAVMLRR